MLNHKIGSKLTFLGKRWTLTKVDDREWYITDKRGYTRSYFKSDSGWSKEGNYAVIWDKVKKPTIIIC